MNTTYRVHMLAFGKENEIREVDVPTDEITPNCELEAVYHYGQNEMQPKPHPSVSVGDVIEINNTFALVAAMGFAMLTTEQFEEYKKIDRLDRMLWVYRSVVQV